MGRNFAKKIHFGGNFAKKKYFLVAALLTRNIYGGNFAKKKYVWWQLY